MKRISIITNGPGIAEVKSLYGQATFNALDNLRIITGFRYTEDTFSSDVTNFFGLQSYLIEDDLLTFLKVI